MNTESVKYVVRNSIFQINLRSDFAQINVNIGGSLATQGLRTRNFKGDIYSVRTVAKITLSEGYKLKSEKRHFCSTECRQEWYSEVWSQTEEWKEESRKRAVRNLSDNAVSTQTKPQIVVNNMLDSLSVAYRNEEPFVYYSIDNYLPEYKLAIEVMGDYWHSSPLKYPEGINDKQKHIISRDKAKHTYIRNHYGIEVLYLWESDILKRPNLCVALIRTYISNDGHLGNYHSFNYHMDNGGLVLNPDIIQPHQERQIAC